MTSDRSAYRRLAALALVLALGCASGTVMAAPISIFARDAAPGSAIFELQADELVTMTAIPFRLLIRDAAGQPVTGARVSCDLTMPSMTMPENRPQVTERDGGYGGELIFTCAMGAWRIQCLAEQNDGSRRVMTFDIEKVRMK
jgi:YtkA-like